MGRAIRTARALAAIGTLLVACGPADPSAPDPPAAEVPAEVAPTEGEGGLGGLPEEVRARLEALGYAATTEVEAGPTGVTVHERGRALAGWNLYVTTGGRVAHLVDMDGRELHRWSDPASPGDPQREGPRGAWWRTVRLFPNGDLLAQADYGRLVKLDADSRPLWVYDETCHHDFDVTDDGRIFAITGSEPIRHPRFPHPLSEDFVVELDENGVELQRVSLLAALSQGDEREALDELRAAQLASEGIARPDVTHLNAVEMLRTRPPGAPEVFQPGRLLLSTPRNHRVLLLDFGRGEIVWSLRGSFRYQHDPGFLPDGRLVLFDNQRERGERSRILAIDPASGEEVWSYGDPPDPAFFSECCGRVHRLANGNLLAIISREARAIEIDPDRRVVWEFRAPQLREGRSAILNDLLRIDPAALDPDFAARVSGG